MSKIKDWLENKPEERIEELEAEMEEEPLLEHVVEFDYYQFLQECYDRLRDAHRPEFSEFDERLVLAVMDRMEEVLSGKG